MPHCQECGREIPEGQKKCAICSEHTGKLDDKVLAHINLLIKKLETDPLNTDIRMNLAELYQKNGLLKEALNAYQKIIDTDASNFQAHNRTAHIHLKLKNLEKAEQAFRAALHIDPSSTASLVGLFRTYYLQNKTIEAIAVGKKLVAQKPENVEFHMLLKNLYQQQADDEHAFSELLALEKLVPDNEKVIREIADYYKKNNDLIKVIAVYSKMLSKKIEDLDLGFYIGVHYFENRKYDDVIVHFSDMLKNENVTPDMEALVHTYLALSYFQKGNLHNTQNMLAEIQPAHARYMNPDMKKKLAAVLFTIGKNHYDNGRLREAIALLEKAIAYDNESTEYTQLLNNIKLESTTKYRALLKKVAMIGGSAVGACLLLFLAWITIRNRIIIHVDPSDDIIILIHGDTITSYDEKTGIARSPIYFIGKHDVSIERTGYETWSGTATIGFAKPARLEIKLIPIYYTLSLTSVPENADVIIDGKPMGITPFTSHEIPACPHAIEVRRAGYAPWKTNLMLTEQDTINLDTIYLHNLAGKWIGEIGSNSFAYNASFNMTIEQTGDLLTIKYFHQPREENKYSGTIKGKVENYTFHAEGRLTYKYYKVFYWAEEKRQVIMQGTLSDSYQRIEGSFTIEGSAPRSWWAQHR